MALVSYQMYTFLLQKIGGNNLTTIISIGMAVMVYLIMVILLRIFSKEEYYMMPFGKKFYDFFKRA